MNCLGVYILICLIKLSCNNHGRGRMEELVTLIVFIFFIFFLLDWIALPNSTLISSCFSLHAAFPFFLYVHAWILLHILILVCTLLALTNLNYHILNLELIIYLYVYIPLQNMKMFITFTWIWMRLTVAWNSDTENIKLVFCAVKDTIMQNALREYNLA